MSKNNNLTAAKSAKNDEFYTQLSDIENELKHYKDHFKGKRVYLNCDDPTFSNFWFFFKAKFDSYGLKSLVSTHFSSKTQVYMLEILEDGDEVKTMLKQNGDFRSEESIEILKGADIVVTNPPFSLFREYVAQLIEYDKEFLVVGNKNAITYKEIFPLIKDNKIWLGNTSLTEFNLQNGSITTNMSGLALWFTNLFHSKRNTDLKLGKSYHANTEDYPFYDNYDAINVDKVVDIPYDYTIEKVVTKDELDVLIEDGFDVDILEIIKDE